MTQARPPQPMEACALETETGPFGKERQNERLLEIQGKEEKSMGNLAFLSATHTVLEGLRRGRIEGKTRELGDRCYLSGESRLKRQGHLKQKRSKRER